jgi:hypothetical protein
VPLLPVTVDILIAVAGTENQIYALPLIVSSIGMIGMYNFSKFK